MIEEILRAGIFIKKTPSTMSAKGMVNRIVDYI